MATTTFIGNRDVVNGPRILDHIPRPMGERLASIPHAPLLQPARPHDTLLDIPSLHGTPGTPNTARVGNIGPTFNALQHSTRRAGAV
jgi:hypothetical protein